MSTEEKRQQLRQQLIAKLREMFQMDQADLDFGIYRIMNAKRDEVERFLEHDLLPTLRTTLEQFQPAGLADKQIALEKAIEAARLAEFDPEQSPKVRQLRSELAQTVDLDRLEEQVYSDLHTFFSRYYQNGDFMSLRRYKEGVYALPYEGEEVKLHWANADQYYIKSAENFTRYAFKTAQGRVRFELAAAATERDNNKATGDNERRFLLAADPLGLEAGELVIRFEYRPDPDKRKQKELNALAVESLLALPALSLPHVADWPQWRAALAALLPTEKNKTRTTLEKHLSDYSAKNTFDYFIHKDLGRFLRRELDFFIKNEVMHLDDIEEQTAPAVEQYLARIKAMRRIAHKLIAFLAQLENFQKRLWLKKKFVLETNWLITLDRIDPRHYPEICRQAETPVRGWDGATRNQREEWVKLFAIDEILPAAPKPGTGGEKQLFEQIAPPHGRADLFQFRHSGESRNPVKSTTWTPAFAGVTDVSALPYSIPLTPEFLQANSFLVLDTAFIDAALKDTLLGDIENLDEQTNGLLVHGENFQALNLLRERYREQVKCIYIDPPYNTGVDEFIYKDSYQHSSWLSLMANRIGLASSMLSIGGVKAISLDGNESGNLGAMFRTIIPGYVPIGEFVWKTRNTDNRVITRFSTDHEYIYLWARHGVAIEGRVIDRSSFKNLDNDSRGVYTTDPLTGKANYKDRPNLHYEIVNKKTGDVYSPDPDFGWITDKEGFEKLVAEDRVYWPKSPATGSPRKKRFLFETNARAPISSLGIKISQGEGNNDLASKMGSKLINFPKPVSVIRAVLDSCSGSEDLILDYFAGSGTTGEAVIRLNKDQDDKRRYCLVEVGEHFDRILKPRLVKSIYSETWVEGCPLNRVGVSQTIKYLRLESYEDACDNLALARSDTQQTLIDQAPALREGYFLNYLLDIESRASLLNLDHFSDPFNVVLSITRNDETREVKVDMPETFNYLLGLRVKTQRRLKGVYEVTGTTPAGDRALILWRNVQEVDNDALDDWFRAYNTRDMEFDLIYVNGDNNLENLRRPDETWKVRLIEAAFHTLMFAVEEV